MTDSELKRAVETVLHGDVRLRGHNIRVDVDAGSVALHGEVEQLAEKRLAINLVRQLREVGEVRDRLRLPPSSEFTDVQIVQHIVDALIQDPNLHEQQVRVASIDGLVTLTGWTNSLEEKRLMGLAGWWVPGVVDLDNRIEVIPAQPGHEGDLVDIIRLAFEKDVLVDPSLIGVKAQGNAVTLVGTARSVEERMAAEHDCYYIWGVEEVHNLLRVQSI
ncbi:MAG: transporter [Cyanobacteria bacterium RYN_339]|nr:transporter [Cyanobacteria bacterium RYN_339]